MSLAIRGGLFNALTGSAALEAKVGNRIYPADEVPVKAAFPYVVYGRASGVKMRTLESGSQLKRDVWLVKAIDRSTSSKLADEIADILDSILDEGTFTVEGKTVIDLYHVGDVKYPEDDGDQSYKHSGATYGVVVA